jgi:Ni,Fe-hydrogenase III large subunit
LPDFREGLKREEATKGELKYVSKNKRRGKISEFR